MEFNKDLITYLEQKLNVKELKAAPVGGGDINRVYCVYTQSTKYLIKINEKNAFPGMFKAESEGLATIKHTNTIGVPKVILQDELGAETFLVMEWIESKRPDPRSLALLGRQLARMHKHSAESFGATADNYMGSLPQSNRSHSCWCDFFIEERLMPMVEIGLGKRLLDNGDAAKFETLYKRLPNLFDEEPAALLHGDLWSGNYLISEDGIPYLIDPAVAYGHREFDIAMTTLFGGFSSEFYNAYEDEFPLPAGWKNRLDLWNIYPLLVHLNLFGLGYLSQVRDNLNQYL